MRRAVRRALPLCSAVSHAQHGALSTGTAANGGQRQGVGKISESCTSSNWALRVRHQSLHQRGQARSVTSHRPFDGSSGPTTWEPGTRSRPQTSHGFPLWDYCLQVLSGLRRRPSPLPPPLGPRRPAPRRLRASAGGSPSPAAASTAPGPPGGPPAAALALPRSGRRSSSQQRRRRLGHEDEVSGFSK